MNQTNAARQTSAESNRVLVVEDEVLVAQDIAFILEDDGYEVIGPFRTVKDALGAIEGDMPDMALLDVNVKDGQVFPVADTLRDNGIVFAFCSAHMDADEARALYPSCEVVSKPFREADLKSAIETISKKSVRATTNA